MKPLPPLAELDPTDVGRLLCEDFGTRLVEESVREELAPARAPDSLPSVTAAVCTKDRPERLARCLHSILALRSTSWGSRLAFDITGRDNAPSDDRAHGGRVSPWRPLRARARVGLTSPATAPCTRPGGDPRFFDDDATVDRMRLSGLVEALGDHPTRRRSRGRCFPIEPPREPRSYLEHGGFGYRFRRITWPDFPGMIFTLGPRHLGAAATWPPAHVLLAMGGLICRHRSTARRWRPRHPLWGTVAAERPTSKLRWSSRAPAMQAASSDVYVARSADLRG
jgi:hypothetical protein